MLLLVVLKLADEPVMGSLSLPHLLDYLELTIVDLTLLLHLLLRLLLRSLLPLLLCLQLELVLCNWPPRYVWQSQRRRGNFQSGIIPGPAAQTYLEVCA